MPPENASGHDDVGRYSSVGERSVIDEGGSSNLWGILKIELDRQ